MLWRPWLLTFAVLIGLAPLPLEADCTAQTPGYQGRWLDPVKGEREIAYLAPDRLLIRDLSTGRVHGVHGSTVWDYDPASQEAARRSPPMHMAPWMT